MIQVSKTYLQNEAKGLLQRIKQLKSFDQTVPMVRSAAVSEKAFEAILELLNNGKSELKKSLRDFLIDLEKSNVDQSWMREMFNRFIVLKLRYNSVLDQMDIFADVLSQRSEHETGAWLSGLDVLAQDGLNPASGLIDSPPLVVFLDRGHGAAIRRARTRLPGNDVNPVGVIQIPRERMVGNGIASSLIHEVGHQAAELLGLTASMKGKLRQMSIEDSKNPGWLFLERWMSEIIADLWAVAQLGVSATIGLMGVVSLPSYFQFRIDINDPHPPPYLRVWLSCKAGHVLFPDSQWERIWKMWFDFFPLNKLDEERLNIIQNIKKITPQFMELVFTHSTDSLKGQNFKDLFKTAVRQPEMLRKNYLQLKTNYQAINNFSPIGVFAILGQAKADNKITAEEETKLLSNQLYKWASNRNKKTNNYGN